MKHVAIEADSKGCRIVMFYSRVHIGPQALQVMGMPVKTRTAFKKHSEAAPVARQIDAAMERHANNLVATRRGKK